MVHPGAADTQAVRATFFIDPNGILRAMVYYPMSNGCRLMSLCVCWERQRYLTVSVQDMELVPGQLVIVPPPKTAEADKRRRVRYMIDWVFLHQIPCNDDYSNRSVAC